jgi:hypothetical protein
MNTLIEVTQPRSIAAGESLRGLSRDGYSDWYEFTVSEAGDYHINLIPDSLEHFFTYYYYYSGYGYYYHYPVKLYDSNGNLIAEDLYQ